MSEVENKVEWCLKKAEKELKENGLHRGLIKIAPSDEKAKQHLIKAEHYFKASIYLKEGNFSDISMSTLFYSTYHCLLAIASKFGFESRNQECTFALISSLIESEKISFEITLLEKIYDFKTEDAQTAVELREKYQYGTTLSVNDEKVYNELIILAKEVLSKTRLIIESQ